MYRGSGYRKVYKVYRGIEVNNCAISYTVRIGG